MRLQKSLLAILSLFFVFLFSCQKDADKGISELDKTLQNVLKAISNDGRLQFFVLPNDGDLASIPHDPKNPLTKEKVKLGKLLYHETGISLNPVKPMGEGTYSCASCHFASAGFAAGRYQGISEGGIGFGGNGEGRERNKMYDIAEIDVQPIKSPTSMNCAYQKNMLWNGMFGGTGVNVGTEEHWTAGTPKEVNFLRYEGLETQAIAGLSVHRMDLDPLFLATNGYIELFDEAFPDVPVEERYENEYGGLAIAAYERTLLSNKAPFQRWLKGDKSAMTEQEKEGALIFFEKAKCANCHTGPALSSMTFYAYGMKALHDCPEEIFRSNDNQPEQFGRGGFTGKAEDMHKFKTPQLYNLADSPYYGHGNSFRSIREVVEYKNKGIPENPRVDEELLAEDFRPLGLTDKEIEDLTVFLTTALRDPDLVRFEPESLPSGQCFPVNDPLSNYDRGCD